MGGKCPICGEEYALKLNQQSTVLDPSDFAPYEAVAHKRGGLVYIHRKSNIHGG